jgi:hypothetical protein
MHNVLYVGHPGYQKIITAIRGQYFWCGMKKYVTDYLDKCMECQKVKVEHRHPERLMQPLPILEWKWELVTIDFITKLPRKTKKHNSIMVAVEKITKAAHFIPMKVTHKAANIVEIYMRKIVRLHGVPKVKVSNRIPNFNSNFWKWFFKGFGTNLNFSTTYHPESYRQIERINRIIEDMLRIYVMENPYR